MFDFFRSGLRDIMLEVKGVDVKRSQEETDTTVTSSSSSSWMVRVALAVGILYIPMAVINIYSCVKIGNYIPIIKYVFLTIFDVLAICFFFSKDKKKRAVSYVFIAVFLIGNFAPTAIDILN